MSFQSEEGGLPTPSRGLLESETEPHELSAEFIFALPVAARRASSSTPTSPALGFSSCSASTTGPFAELGSCCAWPLPCRGRAEVVTARLNLRNSTVDVRGVCNFFSSVLPQQKFEAPDRPVLQLSFIWQAKENTSSRWEGGTTQKTKRKESGGPVLAIFLNIFFLLPQNLPYVNWVSQEGSLFHLRLSLQSLHLPLFCFCGLFPSLSFSHRHFGLLFPILTT